MVSPGLRPSLALGLLAASLACVESKPFFDDDIPLDLLHVGAALISDKGVVRRMTPLTNTRELPVMARSEDEKVWYFGWSSRLEEAGVDLEALRAEPLVPAPDCRGGLPRPSWNFEIPAEGDRGRTFEQEEPLPARITHPSLLLECSSDGFLRPEAAKPPELYANFSIENTCPGSLCQGSLSVDAECRLDIDLGRCVSQRQSGYLGRGGQSCVEPGLGCENVARDEDALLSIACRVGPEPCTFHFYQPERPLQLSIDRVQVAPPLSGAEVDLLPQRVPPFAAAFGRLQHLAVGQERVIALTRADPVWDPTCQDETSPAQLVELETAPLRAGPSAAPGLPCLRLLALDHEDALFGVYGVYPELHLAAFDESGAVTRTRRIPASAPAAVGSYVPIEFTYDAASESLALALHTPAVGGEDRLVFATRDLRTVRTSTLSGLQVSGMRRGRNREGDARLVLAELTQSLAIWWKPWEPREESGAGLVTPFYRQPLIGAAPFRKGSVIGLFADESPGMSRAFISSIGPFEVFAFFEGVIDATAMVEFGSEEEENERFFIAGRERGARRLGTAVLAEYGRSRPRRLLAGARIIGEGIVAGGDQDAAGRAWLYLPWSGAVVRVDPPVAEL